MADGEELRHVTPCVQLSLPVYDSFKRGIDKKTASGFTVSRGIAVDARQNPARHADVDPLGLVVEKGSVDLDYRPQPP